MNLEAKLEQIIEILLRIEDKLGPPAQVPETGNKSESKNGLKPLRPTKAQLEFKRKIEFFVSMNKTVYFSFLRNHAKKSIQENATNLKYHFTIRGHNSNITFDLIDKKIKSTSLPFYIELREWVEKALDRIDEEGKPVWDRAIQRYKSK